MHGHNSASHAELSEASTHPACVPRRASLRVDCEGATQGLYGVRLVGRCEPGAEILECRGVVQRPPGVGKEVSRLLEVFETPVGKSTHLCGCRADRGDVGIQKRPLLSVSDRDLYKVVVMSSKSDSYKLD